MSLLYPAVQVNLGLLPLSTELAQAVVKRVKWKDARFEVDSAGDLRVTFTVDDVHVGPAQRITFCHRAMAPYPAWTERLLVLACASMVMCCSMHEACEHFFFAGIPIMHPHQPDGNAGLTVTENIGICHETLDLFEEIQRGAML